MAKTVTVKKETVTLEKASQEPHIPMEELEELIKLGKARLEEVRRNKKEASS